jgi:hypothetical protein
LHLAVGEVDEEEQSVGVIKSDNEEFHVAL